MGLSLALCSMQGGGGYVCEKGEGKAMGRQGMVGVIWSVVWTRLFWLIHLIQMIQPEAERKAPVRVRVRVRDRANMGSD